MDTPYGGLDTRLIHAGEPKPRICGAVTLPIFQSVTFEYADSPGYHNVRYIRLNNTPSHIALHEKLAAIENAEAALVTASGMSAISTSLLTVLSSGDHILAQDGLYGGTHGFLTHECPAFGITVDWIDGNEPSSWQPRLKSTTRAIFVETMTNPLLGVGDLRTVVEFGRAHGLVSIIDNTFASPVNFCPPDIGFDLSLHSCTKYMNGHGDVAAGAVLGSAEWIEKITHRANHLGGTLDPHAAFLLHRGLKTLGVRVRHQNKSTLRIARFLEDHSAVDCVNYPGLESHPHHARARDLFVGFGGTLSFKPAGGVAAAERIMGALRLAIRAPSLGGVDTLIMRPAVVSHAGLSVQERERLGIDDCLVRLSVGLETTEDLLDDLEQALRS